MSDTLQLVAVVESHSNKATKCVPRLSDICRIISSCHNALVVQGKAYKKKDPQTSIAITVNISLLSANMGKIISGDLPNLYKGIKDGVVMLELNGKTLYVDKKVTEYYEP